MSEELISKEIKNNPSNEIKDNLSKEIKNNLSDEVGFKFFTSQVDNICSPVDKYKCLKLGLARASEFHPELYVRLYRLCLSDAFTLSQLNECWSFNPTVTSFDRTGVKLALNVPGENCDTFDRIGIKLAPLNVSRDTYQNNFEAKLNSNCAKFAPSNTEFPKVAPLHSTINTKSTISNAVKIAPFDSTSKKLAPSSPVESFTTDMKSSTSLATSESLTTDMKLPTSHLSRLDSLIASMLDKGDLYNASLVSRLFQWEYNDCLVLEQMAKATSQTESGEHVLVHLATKLRHGKPLAQFFVAAYRLMCSLGMLFRYTDLAASVAQWSQRLAGNPEDAASIPSRYKINSIC
uniref:Uncharacterized protein n=1 Tax=Cacopsylla melanoneura TaxID=428564 RepID=A0A8D8TXM1_9HEMI